MVRLTKLTASFCYVAVVPGRWLYEIENVQSCNFKMQLDFRTRWLQGLPARGPTAIFLVTGRFSLGGLSTG